MSSPMDEAERLARDLGETHEHELPIHDSFERVFAAQADALIARGWTSATGLVFEDADGTLVVETPEAGRRCCTTYDGPCPHGWVWAMSAPRPEGASDD